MQIAIPEGTGSRGGKRREQVEKRNGRKLHLWTKGNPSRCTVNNERAEYHRSTESSAGE